jgi:hypothetical protein
MLFQIQRYYFKSRNSKHATLHQGILQLHNRILDTSQKDTGTQRTEPRTRLEVETNIKTVPGREYNLVSVPSILVTILKQNKIKFAWQVPNLTEIHYVASETKRAKGHIIF